MLALTFTCRLLLIFLLSDSVKMTDENQLLVLEKQWRQACVLDCARGRHQAVCGSNGRMYKSLCSFQRAQCINRQLRTAAVSTCTDALRSKCQLARSQALRASARSDSSAVFIPECKADGTYAEVQCHNQTGYCWCSSPDGIPMSGSSVLHLQPNCTGFSKPVVPNPGPGGTLTLHMTPAARPHVLSSPASFSSVQTLRLYFTLLDTDADGLLSEREARLLRLLLRRTLRPRRCAKKFMQFCDRNADRRLSAQELTSCLGI
ncbi:SPARC-related modular calcium-binding protein 2-like [Sinocyclocheilus anshuiensis]|uniref:SPARC-related modular calcium-binding protein 2-like n=1 Tax=Sinocyclocheilus anshuiensis TaxID=1608454 RepID=UPI0007B9C8D8|nr:PREDICTED: SPARC-related modular calcium-binding protein 2-like [Sinocyclocheilus anshuiensis]